MDKHGLYSIIGRLIASLALFLDTFFLTLYIMGLELIYGVLASLVILVISMASLIKHRLYLVVNIVLAILLFIIYSFILSGDMIYSIIAEIIHLVLITYILFTDRIERMRRYIQKHSMLPRSGEAGETPLHRALALPLISIAIVLTIFYLICYPVISKWIVISSTYLPSIPTITVIIALIITYMFYSITRYSIGMVMEIYQLTILRSVREHVIEIKRYVQEIYRRRSSIGYAGGLELSILRITIFIISLALPLIIYSPYASTLVDRVNNILRINDPLYSPLLFLLLDMILSTPLLIGLMILFERILSLRYTLRGLLTSIILISIGLIEWFMLNIYLISI